MIAGFVANVLSTSIDVIERWPPEKALAYFATATEIHKVTKVSI